MKKPGLRALAVVTAGVVILVAVSPVPGLAAVGTAFTYQGRLTDAGAPADGSYDMEFRLFDSEAGGSQVGPTVTLTSFTVTAGLFEVVLDFGATAFAGQKRWLQMGVRPGGSVGSFVLLSGREELTPTPNAIYASDSGLLAGQAPSYYLDLANQTGVVSVAQGGTGGTTVEAARQALGAAPLVVPNAGFEISTLDGPDQVGASSSATIGSDGRGLISYYDSSNGDLKAAHCETVACTSATITTLDSTGSPGYLSSLAIGADGLGLIVSYDIDSSAKLKVAHCDDVACSSATATLLEAAPGAVGYSTSVAIGSDGLPLASYLATGGLRVAHCSDAACTSATFTTLSATGSALWSSIAIGTDGPGPDRVLRQRWR